MKLIIAGGRNFKDKEFMFTLLNSLHPRVTEVVCGGATGADTLGAMWAEQNKIPIIYFLPRWEAFGKSAGPIRNRTMAEYADACALFPGGKGTESMFNEARARNLIIYDFRLTVDDPIPPAA